MKILHFLLALIVASPVAQAATTAISGLTAITSPSTNTWIEVADMNAATKSRKYLLTNLVTQANLSTATNSSYSSAQAYADTKLSSSSTLDDDKVAFDDADNLWTATLIGPALEELNDSINAGAPNGTGAKVHWSQLLGVPAGFADGTDDGAGGDTIWTNLDGKLMPLQSLLRQPIVLGNTNALALAGLNIDTNGATIVHRSVISQGDPNAFLLDFGVSQNGDTYEDGSIFQIKGKTNEVYWYMSSDTASREGPWMMMTLNTTDGLAWEMGEKDNGLVWKFHPYDDGDCIMMVDTFTNVTSSDLLRIRNNGVNKFSVSWDGKATVGGLTNSALTASRPVLSDANKTLVSGQIDLANANHVTGVLPAANVATTVARLLDPPLNLSGTSVDLSLTNRWFSKSLGANTTLTFANPTAGRSFSIILTNGASWTITFPTVTWMSGSAPVLDVGAGKVNVFSFYYDGTTYYGDVSQNANAQLNTLGAGITGIVNGTGSTYGAATSGQIQAALGQVYQATNANLTSWSALATSAKADAAAPALTGAGTTSGNLGALLSVGDTTFVDMLKASQTNAVTGTVTLWHATNGVHGVDYTHVRWFLNGSGSDQTLTFQTGAALWRTNVYSPVPPKLTNNTITKMILNCGGPTSSSALQTNVYVSFEYYK